VDERPPVTGPFGSTDWDNSGRFEPVLSASGGAADGHHSDGDTVDGEAGVERKKGPVDWISIGRPLF
jgi:hypothetical protein